MLPFSLHQVESKTQLNGQLGSLPCSTFLSLIYQVFLLLGCVVHDSGVVNGIKINDDLRPLGLELPAKNMD